MNIEDFFVKINKAVIRNKVSHILCLKYFFAIPQSNYIMSNEFWASFVFKNF